MKTIEKQINEKLLQFPKNDWEERLGGYALNHKELGEIQLVFDKSNGSSYIVIKKIIIKAEPELINHVSEQIDLEKILNKL
jgi:hypothetical protein